MEIRDLERDVLAAAFDAATAATAICTPEGRILNVNRAFCETSGYSRDELLEGGFTLLFYPPDREDCLNVLKRCVKEGQSVQALTLRRKGGPDLRVECEARPLRPGGLTLLAVREMRGEEGIDPARGPSGEWLPGRAEMKEADNRLRESELKFRSLMEALPIGVAVTDEDGNFFEANKALWTAFGYESREEFLRKKASDLYVRPDDRLRVLDLMNLGKAKDIEIRVKKKDGTEFLGSLTAHKQDSSWGGKKRYISIFQDITSRKRLEQEVLKAQKLDSVGILAGGIAHDFNNLLLGILGNISVAKAYIPPGEKAFDILTEVEKAAIKTKGLTKQLLTFSRGGEPIKEASSISDILKDTADLVLRGSNVAAEFSFPADLWKAVVDEGQISQVVNNVVMNGLHAMPDGGTISISAMNVVIKSGDSLPLKAGEYIKIAIKDRGMGIPKKILPKIFDPFFTTKQKASGLGLAVSYSIIKKHNGYVFADSGVGVGTTVYIYLPATKEEAKPSGERIIKGKGRILVMDDEELVRDVADEMLHLLGYEPCFATDGEDAIAIYKKALDEKDPFMVVILDLTVPKGMGGKEAVAKLKEIDPGVRCLVSSGYSKDPVMAEYGKYGFCGVIAKPYRVSEFSKAVNDAVNCRT